jgi:hypothetical protein
MTPDAVTRTQLMGENRPWRETVRFLDTQVDPQPAGGARLEHDDARGGEVEDAYCILVDSSPCAIYLHDESSGSF